MPASSSNGSQHGRLQGNCTARRPRDWAGAAHQVGPHRGCPHRCRRPMPRIQHRQFAQDRFAAGQAAPHRLHDRHACRHGQQSQKQRNGDSNRGGNHDLHSLTCSPPYRGGPNFNEESVRFVPEFPFCSLVPFLFQSVKPIRTAAVPRSFATDLGWHLEALAAKARSVVSRSGHPAWAQGRQIRMEGTHRRCRSQGSAPRPVPRLPEA